VPDDGTTLTRAERWLGTLASVAAPISLITAVLFYFGYAASRAQYRYFGIDVDTIGLSTQDYVMRSPQVLLTPVLLLLAVGVLGVSLRAAVQRRVAAVVAGRADDDAVAAVASSRYLRTVRRVAGVLVVGGYAALAAGALLVTLYGLLRGWELYSLVTPLVLALGSAFVGYGSGLATMLRLRNRSRGAPLIVMWLLLTTSVFWATATLAEASGRGLAKDTAADLGRLPGVILDTTERLYLTTEGVRESAIPQHAGQTYRYRYRDLRLLIQGRDRLFLVPSTWSPSNSTLVVPLSGSVRVQFRFVDDPP
jgi:hypothetical protein